MHYANGSTGSARLTVRATDSAGNFVTTDFSVTVVPLFAFGDFAEYQASSSGGTAPGPLDVIPGNRLSSLLNYAFFLNGGATGGVAGLPRMEGTGQSHIFVHLRPKYASDLLYHYEISQDLITWVPAAKDVHYYQHTTEVGDGSVRVELLLLVNWPRLSCEFGRSCSKTQQPLHRRRATAPEQRKCLHRHPPEVVNPFKAPSFSHSKPSFPIPSFGPAELPQQISTWMAFQMSSPYRRTTTP
jgi:hypothetical protein